MERDYLPTKAQLLADMDALPPAIEWADAAFDGLRNILTRLIEIDGDYDLLHDAIMDELCAAVVAAREGEQ